jgi:hypothetical protein
LTKGFLVFKDEKQGNREHAIREVQEASLYPLKQPSKVKARYLKVMLPQTENLEFDVEIKTSLVDHHQSEGIFNNKYAQDEAEANEDGQDPKVDNVQTTASSKSKKEKASSMKNCGCNMNFIRALVSTNKNRL